VKLEGVYPASRDVLSMLPEPRERALIACQIQDDPRGPWVDRTYAVVRAVGSGWLIDFGAGRLEPRRDWSAVLDWLWRMAPRDVELMEVL